MASLLEGICEPLILTLARGWRHRLWTDAYLKTFIQTITSGSASGLDVPSSLPERVKAKLVSDLSGVHGILAHFVSFELCEAIRMFTHWQILLVGEDKEQSITELVLVEHALQLLTSLDNTVAIVGVDDEDDTLGVLEVMSPQRTDLVLSSDIPHGELDVLVLDSLDVETWSITSISILLPSSHFRGSCEGAAYQWWESWSRFHQASACTGWSSFRRRQDQPSECASPSCPIVCRTASRT